MKIDKRYNRLITPASRIPMANLGGRGIGQHMYKGHLKCKLAHGFGYSLVVPDFLFVGPEAKKWVQPLAFGPNVIDKLNEDEFRCRLNVDIAGGHRLVVEFWNKDLREQLPDGSELYECSVHGPSDLMQFMTGRSLYSAGSAPKIELFHHTSKDAKRSILSSGEFRLSRWNIQGTTKQLTNVGYVYFTPVHRIEHPDDLKLIAMASDGSLTFTVDNFSPPRLLMPGWEAQYADNILALPVYRASTTGRTESLVFFIESSVLAPQHIWRHAPNNDQVWYEICNPFVHRVGIEPDKTLGFAAPHIQFADVHHKRFDYVVVGDARTVSGLAAPYDEEDTTHVMKFEREISTLGILDFWFSHGNTDLFTHRDVELQDFRKG